jgi:hypothetical protein
MILDRPLPADYSAPRIDGEVICHRVQGVHIPGCWTCVIYGGLYASGHSPDCTCPRRPRRSQDDRLVAIEARLIALEAIVKHEKERP